MSEEKDKESAKKKRALASIANYQDTFTSPHGKKVLLDLMRRSGMTHVNFSPDSPYVTSFNEGSRSVVLYILEKLNVDTLKLKQLIDDNYKEHDIFGE